MHGNCMNKFLYALRFSLIVVGGGIFMGSVIAATFSIAIRLIFNVDDAGVSTIVNYSIALFSVFCILIGPWYWKKVGLL